MLKKLALSAAFLAASFSYSHAQGAGSDWSGVYVGGVYSFADGTSRHTDSVGATTGDFGIDGSGFGMTLGINRTAGNIVYGAETDISFSDFGGRTISGCPAGCTTDIDWFMTLRGRIGYNGNNFMPYITGGLAVGEISANTNGIAAASDVNAGWTVGAGAEFMLNSNWTIKGEYLFVDLGDIGVPTPSPVRARADQNHIFRLGANFKF